MSFLKDIGVQIMIQPTPVKVSGVGCFLFRDWSNDMAKKVLLAMAGCVGCMGCAGASFFSVANDVTGTIINTGLIVGVVGLLSNLGNITQLIQGLVGGGQ
jgi:hypothetical protein